MARKIMIIGASSGIGRRLAERYAEKNHRIGISGRREELLKQIQQQHPQNIEYEAFDVRESDNFMHLESLRDKIGGLDLLIICAGIGEPDKELVWEYDLLTVETNVDGFVSIANWGFNQFVKQGFGHLVNI